MQSDFSGFLEESEQTSKVVLPRTGTAGGGHSLIGALLSHKPVVGITRNTIHKEVLNEYVKGYVADLMCRSGPLSSPSLTARAIALTTKPNLAW